MLKTAVSFSKQGLRRDSAYEQIQAAIIFNDLPAGSSVHERLLADQFGMGLAAIRDALLRLSIEGFVERRPWIGTRIPRLDVDELYDVYQVRMSTEGEYAHLVAQRATPADLHAMGAAFTGYEEAIEKRDYRALVRMDRVFHRAFAAASKNKVYERVITQVHDKASRFAYCAIQRLDTESLRKDIKSHFDVVAAIRKGDSAAAADAMRTVLRHFSDYVRLQPAGLFTSEGGSSR